MKKIVAVILLTLCFLSAKAELRWGPVVGTDMSSFFWKQNLTDTHARLGFNAGVMSEIMIPGIGFGVDFALRYNQHSASVNFGEREVWSVDGFRKENVTVHALQIPVNLRFKWTRLEGLEQYIAPFAYAGPVISFTLGTSCKKIIEHPEACFGVQVGGGVELFEHWQLSGGYYWGVSYEIRTIKLDNFSARPQGWNINVAYLF
ncbi:MAG: PorT family protein [Muribaculaceae bacterium]|nr:PorT family protein [Muribaculaceae bacterium]